MSGPGICSLIYDDDLVPALPAGFVTNLISPQASTLYKVLQSTEVAIFMLGASFFMFCSVPNMLLKNRIRVKSGCRTVDNVVFCFARRSKDLRYTLVLVLPK